MLKHRMSPSFLRTDQELLTRIERAPGGRAGYKQLIRELGLGGGQARQVLLEQLAGLVKQGKLFELHGRMWTQRRPEMPVADATTDQSTVGSGGKHQKQPQATFSREGRERFSSGRLSMHADGFGFVRPESGPAAAASPVQDVFIPPPALHGAMHGDLVLVDVDPPSRDGRLSGRIARVLTRRNQTVVGIFHYARRGQSAWREVQAEIDGNYVQPWDDRLAGPIEIPPGEELHAQAAGTHRTLGDEALQQARTPQHSDLQSEEADKRWPLEGLAVEVEITRFPQPGRPAAGRVIEVLGPPDAFGVDVEIVIRKHGIPHVFPAHVLAEADEQAAKTVEAMAADDLAHREDFRGLPIVTIDGETARDFDDAVLVRTLEDGTTELQVHIADVSEYVQPGTALDTEARVRGTSVYFPDRAVPMLPHALSSGMCSLRPHEDRLVLSCVMRVDAQGEVLGYRVAEGIIRSARRMTYSSVQHCLNASPVAAEWNLHTAVTPEPTAEGMLERERVAVDQPELPGAIDRMLELALRLNRKRVRRGSIDFDLPEPVVQFDPDGNMKAIVRSERGWAHRLIEEFMLSANECVATWLTAQGVPAIYRIHEMPDPKRIIDFEETAAAFGQTLGIGALPVKRLTMKTDRRHAQRQAGRGRDSRPAQAHELPERIAVTPQMYQRLVRKIAGKPEERILAYLMLRSLKQARYSEKNEGHFALASPCYTHFTSPIRRYPDLIVHRLVRAMLESGADPVGGPVLSSDLQPWKVEHRQQGAGAAVRESTSAPMRSTEPRAVEEPAQRPNNPARIGWSGNAASAVREALRGEPLEGSQSTPVSAPELADIAAESSQAERRASDAERELIEWKKMKFMADRIGEDFRGIILSVTKFGFFVELDEMFIEGLVPLAFLPGDFYSFRDADRSICGARTGHCFRVGDRVEVILDRIDRQQRRLQFALLPGTEPKATAGGLRRGNKDASAEKKPSKKSGKSSRKKKGHGRNSGPS